MPKVGDLAKRALQWLTERSPVTILLAGWIVFFLGSYPGYLSIDSVLQLYTVRTGDTTDHAPLMTTLKPGFITVTDTANVAHVFYVRGGFADVAPTGLTILAEEARAVADFNRTEIEALIASGMTALEAAKTAEEQDRLQNEIDQWKNLLLDASVGRDVAH